MRARLMVAVVGRRGDRRLRVRARERARREEGAMELRLSKPQRCSNGLRVFSKLQYTWTAGAPAGAASGSVPMGCKISEI